MSRLEYHEAANIYPLLEGKAFEELKADIERHGQRLPIATFKGKILDGRNRYRACLDLDIDPEIREWEGDDPIGFVLSANSLRLHMTESQRSMVAAKIQGLYEAEAQARRAAGLKKGDESPVVANLPQRDTGKSRDKAAAVMDVSPRSVQAASKVIKEGVSDLAPMVDGGEVSVSAAATVADLPKAEQKAIVARGPKAVKAKAAEIRKARPKAAIPDKPHVNGTTKVNGVVQPDPPDIAAARAAGRIGPNVVPEVTDSAPEPLAEPGPAPAAELGDQEWVETLPLFKALAGRQQRLFVEDAVLYRRLEPHRKTYAYHATRAMSKRGRGAYHSVVSRFLKREHPKDWIRCAATEYGGCGGTGEVPLIGPCVKCHGNGYWIK